MGGCAFLTHSSPLPTPRMPPKIYQQVLSQTLALLQKHYNECASPIEGPGKKDFGDIDVLVSSPKSPEYDAFSPQQKGATQSPMRNVGEKVKVLLGAEAFIVEKGNPTINLAIAWPEETLPFLSNSPAPAENEKGNEERKEKKYIQIDIHHLPSPSAFRWELFHSAHSDLWNILGTTIRPFGLTANDNGLYIRIPEIELLDRKKSMIFLTSHPSQVLEFLGLEEEKWWTEFGSQEEMFRFATGCRMFWIKEEKSEREGEGEVVGEVAVDGQGGKEGGEMSKKKLKHNDRQRMNKRPIFKAWIEEFIPKLREEGGSRGAKVTRDEIREEALERFGVRLEWETRVREWRLERNRIELGTVIKGCVPEAGVEGVDSVMRAAAIRVLRGVIKDGEGFDGSVSEVSKPDEKGLFDLEKVKEFVELNWRRAGEIGLERQHAKSVENFKLKEKKKTEEAAGVEKDTPVAQLNT